MRPLFIALLGAAAAAVYFTLTRKTRPGFVEVKASELKRLKLLEQEATEDADPRFFSTRVTTPPKLYH